MSSCHENIVTDDIGHILAAPLPWHRLAGKTVAVTGASGFIGSYLVRSLLALHPAGKVAAPVRVIAIVRNPEKAARRFADLDAGDTLSIVECDLSLPDGLNVRADYFIHAASQASPRFYGTDPVGTLAPNVIGSYKLLQLAQASAAECFLYISSSEVYGDTRDHSRLSEQDYGVIDPTDIRSCYAESKRMGETLALSWMRQYGLPVRIIRPFHTYGPGIDLQDGRVFADFVADIVHRRDISMNSDGAARRAFCYISDAIRGLFYVLFNGQAGSPYNVANPAGDLSIYELAQLLTGLYPDLGLQVIRRGIDSSKPYLPSHFARLLPDVTQLEALGWKAMVPPAAGFKKMVESYS